MFLYKLCVFSLLLLVTANSVACRSEPYERVGQNVSHYFDRSDLVLTAEIIELGDTKDFSQMVLLKPLELWKGQEMDAYPVVNKMNTSCSREFSADAGPYIVFATWLADLNMYQIDMFGGFFSADKDKGFEVQQQLIHITNGSN